MRERAAVHACAPFRERKKVEKKSQTGEREIGPFSQPRGRSHASALGLFDSCTTFCVHYFALFFIFTCTRRGGPFFLNAMTVQHCGDRKSNSQDVRRVKAFSTISLSLSLSLSRLSSCSSTNSVLERPQAWNAKYCYMYSTSELRTVYNTSIQA